MQFLSINWKILRELLFIVILIHKFYKMILQQVLQEGRGLEDLHMIWNKQFVQNMCVIMFLQIKMRFQVIRISRLYKEMITQYFFLKTFFIGITRQMIKSFPCFPYPYLISSFFIKRNVLLRSQYQMMKEIRLLLLQLILSISSLHAEVILRMKLTLTISFSVT